MKRSLAGVVLGVVLVAGGLSGCGGDDAKPSPSPTKSVPVLSASPSPSVGQRPTGPIDVDPPERPAAMDNADEAGAVAAAEYFLRLTVYASATGDTTELEAMSGEGCKFCQSYISSVEKLHEGGGWASLPKVELLGSAGRLTSSDPVQYQVELDTRKSAYRVYEIDGHFTDELEENLIMGFVLVRLDDWYVAIAEDFPEGSTLPEED